MSSSIYLIQKSKKIKEEISNLLISENNQAVQKTLIGNNIAFVLSSIEKFNFYSTSFDFYSWYRLFYYVGLAAGIKYK